MKANLDIDEDVLEAARELATLRRTTMDRVLSDLARQGLSSSPEVSVIRNGVPLLPPRPGEQTVTMETVNQLRDEDV